MLRFLSISLIVLTALQACAEDKPASADADSVPALKKSAVGSGAEAAQPSQAPVPPATPGAEADKSPATATPAVTVSSGALPEPVYKIEYKPELLAKAIGHKVGRQLAASYGPFVAEPLARLPIEEIVTGVRAGLMGERPWLSPKTAHSLALELDRRIAASRASRAREAEKRADAFLAENAKKPGVKTSPSGVQYQILKPGTGPRPGVGDSVQVRYKGTLQDGAIFDQNLDAKEPATFPIDQLIPGSAEMALSMSQGAKWRFWIPARLAYGDQGNGTNVGPGELLVFEQELVGIVKPESPTEVTR